MRTKAPLAFLALVAAAALGVVAAQDGQPTYEYRFEWQTAHVALASAGSGGADEGATAQSQVNVTAQNLTRLAFHATWQGDRAQTVRLTVLAPDGSTAGE